MPYKIYKLQNASSPQAPTIEIDEKQEGWNEAYSNWLSGKNPTESQEWKNGIFALSKQV